MLIGVIAILVLAAAAAARAGRQWLKLRGERVVECPENRRPAGVKLAVGQPIVHSLAPWTGGEWRLSSCSRWPERAGCGQECLSQIQDSPEDCLVRNILARWYRDKSCASCGRPFGEIDWTVRKPALREPGGATLEWSAIPAEKLSETLAVSLPVCFACHMANILVREHPELAVQRPSMPVSRTHS